MLIWWAVDRLDTGLEGTCSVTGKTTRLCNRKKKKSKIITTKLDYDSKVSEP